MPSLARRVRQVPATLRTATALGAAVACLLAAGAAPAAAALPQPAFPSTIDAYAAYEPETTCSPTVKPGVAALRDVILRPEFGGTSGDYGTVRDCTVGGPSGHHEGRAMDWMMDARIPSESANAQAFLTWLLATDAYGNKNAMARRLGIMYLQHNNKMWRAYRPQDGWQPQYLTVNGVKTDCATLGPSYATACHRDHIHISMSWAGARKQTTYWTTQLPTQPAGVLPGTLGTYPGDGVVKLGRTNDAVLRYERRLNALGLLSSGAVNGIYGDVTDTATRTFQRRAGLVVDGIVGPKTWAAADKATPGSLSR